MNIQNIVINKLFFIIGFIFYTTNLIYQKVTILNSSTGLPIENVAVFNNSMNISSLSNEFGEVDISDFNYFNTLIFSYLSFVP